MDPTTQALVAALLGAVLGGGVILAWHVSERQLHAPTGPADGGVPDGVATVLSVLRPSALVVDENDDVVQASAPAYAMGLVRSKKVTVEQLSALVQQVRRDGQLRETELVVEI